MRSKHSQVRTNNMRGIRYNLEDLDRMRKDKDVDVLNKGQNAKAAQLLMECYYEQESARNMPEVITAYKDYKTGNYGIDYNNSGRGAPPPPPVDWPFSASEWELAANNGPQGLLCKATAYMLQERERLMRQHEQIFNHGVDALDPVQLERLNKSNDKAQRLARRNWRERMKDSILVTEDAMPLLSQGYASASSISYPDAASNIISNYFDAVVEINAQ